MQISPINFKNYSKQNNNKLNTMQTNFNTKNMTDCFVKTLTPSFKGWCVDKKKFNILDQSDDNLKNLAEIFHKQSDTEIENACKTRHTNFIGYTSKSKSEQAFKEFMPHVNKVRKHSVQVEQDIARLTELAAKGDSNFSKQQERISKTFFKLLEVEQSDRKIPKQNGILIYGNAPSIDKTEFVDWFKKNVPAQVQEFTYDESKPFESIKKMVALAEEAEIAYRLIGKRTILHLKDMEKLLTAEETLENIKMIARFKQFAEHCSERYHTTLLMSTNYPLEDFEEASIGSQRFETLINLKDGIKPKQKLELEKLQKEKERLEDQVSLLYKYYWYESEPDYSSSDNDRPMWGPYEDDEWQYRM